MLWTLKRTQIRTAFSAKSGRPHPKRVWPYATQIMATQFRISLQQCVAPHESRFSVLWYHVWQALSPVPYEQLKPHHRFTPCISSAGHLVQLTVATQAKCHSRPACYATINTITSFYASVVTIWQRIQKTAGAADGYQTQTVFQNKTVKSACKGPEYFHLQAGPVVYTGTDLRDCAPQRQDSVLIKFRLRQISF